MNRQAIPYLVKAFGLPEEKLSTFRTVLQAQAAKIAIRFADASDSAAAK